jgi:RNA polymerase sigma-70 factor (ECF subfamily)
MSLFASPFHPRRGSGVDAEDPEQPHRSEADDLFIEAMHAEYAGLLLSVVMRMTGGDRHWAEDVVQETLLRAWRHARALRTGSGSRGLMPWLTTVARRIVINDRRSRCARPYEVDDTVLASIGVSDETERALQRIVIEEALARLTPAHRRVVVEMYLRGRSVQEVAYLLGIPAGTVKSRLHHAIRAMRAAMLRRGVTR